MDGGMTTASCLLKDFMVIRCIYWRIDVCRYSGNIGVGGHYPGNLIFTQNFKQGAGKKIGTARPVIVISGKMRLAVAASVFWPAVVAAFMQPWEKDFYRYLYLGVGPVALIWIIYWVLTGFRKK